MMKIDKSFIGIVILLLGAGILSSMLYFRQLMDSGEVQISALPKEIAEWKGEDIELDERTYEILETRNVVMREYKNPAGQSVYLYMVYSDINRKVAHPPEVCYIGGGREIIEKGQVQFSVPGLEGELLVNTFTSRKEGIESLVYYWFKAGDKFTTHYLTQQAKAVLSQMTGKKASAALIRISTVIDGGEEKAAEILQGFSRKLIPLILEYTP